MADVAESTDKKQNFHTTTTITWTTTTASTYSSALSVSVSTWTWTWTWTIQLTQVNFKQTSQPVVDVVMLSKIKALATLNRTNKNTLNDVIPWTTISTTMTTTTSTKWKKKRTNSLTPKLRPIWAGASSNPSHSRLIGLDCIALHCSQEMTVVGVFLLLF